MGWRLLAEIHLEEEEECKNYLIMTPDYLVKLFELAKDDIKKNLCNVTAHKIKFLAVLVTFNEEILNGKINFLCSVQSHVHSCTSMFILFLIRS